MAWHLIPLPSLHKSPQCVVHWGSVLRIEFDGSVILLIKCIAGWANMTGAGICPSPVREWASTERTTRRRRDAKRNLAAISANTLRIFSWLVAGAFKKKCQDDYLNLASSSDLCLSKTRPCETEDRAEAAVRRWCAKIFLFRIHSTRSSFQLPWNNDKRRSIEIQIIMGMDWT